MSVEDTSFGPIVSVDWLAEHVSDPEVLVIDVRPFGEYLAAHIPGALHADLGQLRLPSSNPTIVERWQTVLEQGIQNLGITPEHKVVFTDTFSGTMAATGVWLLDVAGLGNGAMLDGGLLAWQRAGQGFTDEPSDAPTPSGTKVNLNRELLATMDDLDAEIEAGTGQRLDTRSDLEFNQGAIPGASHVEWQHNLDAEGKFRSTDELAALYQQAGLEPDQQVTTYCAGGFRASHSYLVLRLLGYRNVRNYMPSWGEWGQR